MRVLRIANLPKVRDNWIDRDTLMLHACFQIFEDFIEKENVISILDNDSNKAEVAEYRLLYTWWKERKKTIYRTETDDSGHKEDREMLQRLINIRETLWT